MPPPPAPSSPRYHVARLTPESQQQYPGLLFVRLTCLPPELWAQVEAELKRLGVRSF